MLLPLSTIEKDGGNLLKQKDDNLGVGGELKNLKVFADIWVDPQQLLMVTVAVTLKAIGYEIEDPCLLRLYTYTEQARMNRT
ncbi:hypothetical protein L6452_03685 [Arctium lappa]|uniref:Uncharacterized protein n=1 Tax=Arctium lappa TaxID=4217 RepID=A0ACB9FMJ1_ARCLA|nr:hypothetical protein L6452_03685 [Arctium lappa]